MKSFLARQALLSNFLFAILFGGACMFTSCVPGKPNATLTVDYGNGNSTSVHATDKETMPDETGVHRVPLENIGTGTAFFKVWGTQLKNHVKSVDLYLRPINPKCHKEGFPDGVELETWPGAHGTVIKSNLEGPKDLLTLEYKMFEYIKLFSCGVNTPILNMDFKVWAVVTNIEKAVTKTPEITLRVTADPSKYKNIQ